MKKLWNKVKYYYLTHDGIELFLFACVYSCFGFIAYHAINGIIGRFF